MSIRKDVTVKITNNNATLDMPLQIYELDHGIELRFKLMDYKYKYTKDPQNILNSSDEDILEAYTTIINPRGYELQQINGEVKDDIVIFMIDSSYTDEIDEIGTYSLQIHIKCACSEFSIPPIQFEVLQRLKGIKVVTDGEDSIDDSALIDNYSNFISDETGKLLIEWKKGDIISSVKLNAMVEVINNAVDEEAQRQLNEVKREQQELERQNKVREALNSVDVRVDEAMIEYETRFNALTISQQQDMEVIDARDGEVSLKARLDRDLRKPLQVYEDVEGSYISCDNIEGYLKNVEILGNTIQNQDDLADIRSVGDKLGNQELYEIPVLSCGKNLFHGVIYKENGYYTETGEWSTTNSLDTFRIKCKPNTQYIKNSYVNGIITFFDSDNSFISGINSPKMSVTTPNNCYWVCVSVNKTNVDNAQFEEGTVSTPYEPYQEDKLTILSPTPLEKVGDVADRIVYEDGVWGVEKNVETLYFKDLKNPWIYSKPDWVNASLYGIDFVYDDYNMTRNNKKCISNKFSVADNIWGADSPNKLGLHETANSIYITVPRDINTVVAVKEYVKDSYIKYATTQPTFIPLPHDQQIKLRTFANKTNISFGCEIEPTLKASVPKSIGATVNTHTEQIDNLGKELDRVKKLEESVASTVTTESDFTTVEQTSNGYFEDVKLEGRTLVNLAITTECDIPNIVTDINLPIKENCEYTVYGDFKKISESGNYGVLCCTSSVYLDSKPESGDVLYIATIESGKGSEWRMYFNTGNCIKIIPKTGEKYMHIRTGGITNGIGFSNLVILEGDHTQNPPEFFEGLKSVGQDVEEISVLSQDGMGNLFVNDVVGETGDGNNANGTLYPTMYEPSAFRCRSANLIKVKPNTDYYFSSKHKFWFAIAEFDSENRQILENGWTIYSSGVYRTSPNCENIIVLIKKDDNSTITPSEVYNGNIQIKEGSVKTEYTPHQSNKKRILYYNDETDTWEKPILRQWDSIEKHSDGKYYYHKRSGEVVLDGSEDWIESTNNSSLTNTIAFYIGKAVSGNTACLAVCDKIPSIITKVAGVEYDNIFISASGKINIVILKTKLSTQNTAGFKQWLQANPTTVVYQLAAEEIYECTSIDLMTYENETNFIVNAGAIAPVSTLKVMCNINNVVRELQQKVSNLENYIQHVMIDALNNALNE